MILIATGSEVTLAVDAHERLVAAGIRSRVVSMPSWDVFEQQPAEYRDSGAAARGDGAHRARAGVDVRLGALRRTRGRVIGMHTFGASAPLKELQTKFGFEPDTVVSIARELLGK